jgi:hypothetical protein
MIPYLKYLIDLFIYVFHKVHVLELLISEHLSEYCHLLQHLLPLLLHILRLQEHVVYSPHVL